MKNACRAKTCRKEKARISFEVLGLEDDPGLGIISYDTKEVGVKSKRAYLGVTGQVKNGVICYAPLGSAKNNDEPIPA